MPMGTMPPRRILVVRDDPASAKELATQLRKKGHEVEIAYDGPSALASEPAFRPDIVIIDVALRDVDACAVARSLRARMNRDVLLVAAGDSAEGHARAEQSGCFTDHLAMWKGMPFLPRLQLKLADQSVEDWMAFELHGLSNDDFALRMFAAAAGRFTPDEMAPLIPDELLREIRTLAESPPDLENYLALGARPAQSGELSPEKCGGAIRRLFDDDREGVLAGASVWFRFFNP